MNNNLSENSRNGDLSRSETIINIQQITKTYPGDIRALRSIDLEIGSGMFGLVGPNGAGKTTLMRILAGLVHPTSGSACIFGHDILSPAGKQTVKALLGYLPQELGLPPELTGREFLHYVARLKGLTDPIARKNNVEQVLEEVRLAPEANRRLKTYSGGMKRRVGIAQALLGEPKLLIVDEPTSGLDPEERVRLRNLLSDMARSCTVILSTHIIEDISHSCNDLVVIDKGRALFHGSPRQLIAQARGKVWYMLTPGNRPDGELTTVSTLHLAEGIQYRVIGNPGSAYPDAQEAEPSLEDGYIWLMRTNES
jgi:ABC-2 type transport system ATP-binding protein